MKKKLASMVFALTMSGAFSQTSSAQGLFWPTPERDPDQEPDSPDGDYKFNLGEVQRLSRLGVSRANAELAQIESKPGDLEKLAQIYFSPYLSQIASYNLQHPNVVDLNEAFRTEVTVAHTLKAFKEAYPDLVYDQSSWMFNNVGGTYANTIIIYCSPTEYLVIWGTSLRAGGRFSGYYPFMNEFDVMITGRMLSHDVESKGHLVVEYKPVMQNGKVNETTVDTSNLKPSNVRSYTLEEYTYMVSYAQGNMIKAFGPGAIMPGIFVSQDFGGLWAHIKECAAAYNQTDPFWLKPINLMRRVSESIMNKVFAAGRSSEEDGKVNNYRVLDVIKEFYNQ